MTLKEVFIGNKSKILYLRIIGCVEYFHILSTNKNKLDSKVVCTFFKRHAENCCSYYCYNLITKKILIHQNMQFDEENFHPNVLFSIESSISFIFNQNISQKI